MGYDVGASGAFGLLLSDHKDKLGDLYTEFQTEASELARRISDDELNDDEQGQFDFDLMERLGDRFRDRFIEKFKAIGIDVPARAYLFWTGNGDNRPGRCDTKTDDFVLGFGLFTMPWDYPPMDESFTKAAQFHTWVWGG